MHIGYCVLEREKRVEERCHFTKLLYSIKEAHTQSEEVAKHYQMKLNACQHSMDETDDY